MEDDIEQLLHDEDPRCCRRRLLAAVKGTMREAWRMGQLSTDDYSGAIDVKAIKGNGIEQAAGRALSEAEKIAIIAVLGSGRPVDIRNRSKRFIFLVQQQRQLQLS